MIKALIFDCFGVFYADPVLDHMRNPQTPVEEANALHSLDEQAARGKVSKVEFVQRASQVLQCREDAVEQRFFHSKHRDQELTNLVRDLHGKYKVALLSNIGADMMDGFFTPNECNELFDATILSGRVGYAKPDPEIFRLTCSELSVDLSEAVMIDDVQSNIDAAKCLGMQGIHYVNVAQCKAELGVILAS